MKKGLTLLLTVVMLLTTVTANASAASFADTEGKKCETAVEVLAALGIVEGKAQGAYEPDSSLTRAEMATIILRAMNMAENASGRDIFTDVPSSHWAYANIATAYQLGFVNGTSETTFEPDAVVTYEQAVKMVVAALGYTVQADAMGGYPSGYLAKAAHLDILKGVKTGGEMSRGDMAVLLYNALDVELLQKTTYGEDTYEFEANETATLLSYYLKVDKVTDMVTATPMAKLENVGRLLNDEVAVGSPAVVMKKGETDAQNMLGVRSEIYTRNDDILDMPVVIAIVPRTGAQVLELTAQDIESVSGGRMTYLDAEGKDKEVIVSGAKVLLNGKAVANPTDDTFMPKIGTVRLVANSGSDYELAIVESYKNYVVKSVNTEESKVNFKENKDNRASIVMDLSDDSIATVLTDENGKALTLDDLQEWDVVSIAEDDEKNPTIRRVYRSYVMTSGTITEMSTDEVVIADKTYRVAPSLDTSLLKVGKTAGFYLDFTGAIAAVDESYSAGNTYGWLQRAEYTKGLEGKAQVKLFTQSGEWKVYTLAERVKFNGASVSADAVMAKDTRTDAAIYEDGHAPQLLDANGDVIPQLVAYDVNSNNEITELQTAQNLTNADLYNDADKLGGTFSMDWYANNHAGQYSGGWSSRFNGTAAGSKEFGGNNETVAGVFFGRVVRSAATKIFVIPADPSDDKLYSMSTSLSLEAWRITDCVSFYDVSERYLAGAIVIRNDFTGTAKSDDYPESKVSSAVVTGISTVLNEDGEAVTAIKMKNYSGGEVTAKVSDPEFKCLYAFANANLAKDPDWYAEHLTKKDPKTGEMQKYNYLTVSDLLTVGRSPNTVKMYLPIQKLQPGDVIQYQLDDYGNLKMANVCFRGNYGGEVEFTAKISPTINVYSIVASTKDNYYNGAALLVHGNVKDVFDTGIFVDVNLGDTKGQKTANTAMHVMPKTGTFYLFDREKETLRTITPSDIMPGDEVFSIWSTETQRMFIVYRPTTPDVYVK